MRNETVQMISLALGFVALLTLPGIGHWLTSKYYERIRRFRGYFAIAAIATLLVAFSLFFKGHDALAVGPLFWLCCGLSMAFLHPVLHDKHDKSPAWG